MQKIYIYFFSILKQQHRKEVVYFNKLKYMPDSGNSIYSISNVVAGETFCIAWS